MPPRRRATRWLIGVGAFLALFFAVYTGVYTLWNDEAIARTISAWVSNPLRGRGGPTRQAMVMRRAHYPYWGGVSSVLFNTGVDAQIWDTTIWDPEGHEIMYIPYATGQMFVRETILSQLLTALPGHRPELELHFAGADVRAYQGVAPRCLIATERSGEVNLIDAFAGKAPPVPNRGGMRIRLDSATLHDVEFGMSFPGWHGEAHGVSTRASLAVSTYPDEQPRGATNFTYRLEALESPSGALTLAESLPSSGAPPSAAPDGPPPPPWVFPLRNLRASKFGAFPGHLEQLAFTATAESRGAQAQLDGRLLDTYSSAPGVDLTIGFTHGAGLLKMLPTGTLLDGDPDGTVRFHGPFSAVVIDGHGAGVEVHVGAPGGLDAHQASADFRLAAARLVLDHARARVGDGSVSGSLEIDFNKLTWGGIFTGERIDPSGIGLVPASARPYVAGRLGGHVRLDGSLTDHPERIRIRGLDLSLHRSARALLQGTLPEDIEVRGGLRYAPEKVLLDGLQVSGDGVTATARGELDPVARTIPGADLIVDARKPGRLLAKLGLKPETVGSLHASARISGPLLEPVATGSVEASDLNVEGRPIPRLDARIAFEHGRLSASGLEGEGPIGAALSGTARLDLFNGSFEHPRDDPPLALELRARDVAIPILTRSDAILGWVHGLLRLDGTIRHPRGEAELEVPSMKVFGDPYRRGQLSVLLEGGGAQVRRLYLEREGGGYVDQEPGREGRIGRDGSLDLHVISKDFPLAAIPQLRDLPVPMAGTLSGRVDVGGTLKRWTPSGVIEAAAIKIREVTLGSGRVDVTNDQGALKIAGEFFDRFKIGGRVNLYPSPSCEVRVTFADYPLEQLIPEMGRVFGSGEENAEAHASVSGDARITFDMKTGVQATLTLSKVLLTLSVEEEADGTRRTDEFRNDPGQPVIIRTDGTKLTFENAILSSRAGEFEIKGDLSATSSNLLVRGQLQLALLEYFFSSLFEHTHGEAWADLRIRGRASRPEVTGRLELSDAELKPKRAEGSFQVPSGVVEFEPGKVILRGLRVQLDGDEAQADGSMSLEEWVPKEVALDVKGRLSPTLLTWIAPENIAQASGQLDVHAHLEGRWPKPKWNGRIDVTNLAFREKRLGRDIRIASGTVSLRNYDLRLGEGCPGPDCKPIIATVENTQTVRVWGQLGFPGFALGLVKIHFEGEGLEWGTPTYAVTFAPKVDLEGNATALALSGEVLLSEGRYTQNFDYIGTVIRPRVEEREEPFYKGWPLIEKLGLDVTVRSQGQLYVRNNLTQTGDLSFRIPQIAVGGTLSQPTLNGDLQVDEDGRFTIPFLRTEFVTQKGTIAFDANKAFPVETPTLSVYATSEFQDRNEIWHTIELTITGTYREPNLDLRSKDGWDKNNVLAALLTGASIDENRRSFQADPSARGGGSADPLVKQFTGVLLGGIVEDPLKRVFHLDLVRIELGTDSVKFRLCPYSGRNLKLCGIGDVGFVTTTRYSAYGEFKLADELSLVGSAEHIEHGLDTTEDIVNRLRLQLQLRLPIH